MTTKGSRRRIALARAKEASNERYPDPSQRGLRIGFIAGAMWHREHPWHTPADEVEVEDKESNDGRQ